MGYPSWEGGYFQPNNNPYIKDALEGEYLTSYLTRKATEFIQEHQDGPFYLQLSYYSPHSPYQAPKALVEKYQNKKPENGHHHPVYAAMIEVLDAEVGKIMDTLKKLNLENNTILIFYSDNGGKGGYEYLANEEEYNPNHNVTSNLPLKGGKTTFFEGGIRVPLIIRWPGVIPVNSTYTQPVISIDFYPTILDAAGINHPETYHLDGESLFPVLKNPGNTLERNNLFWHFPGYPNSIYRTSPVSVIRSGPWKLLKFYETGKTELYHLEKDPGEQNELGKEHIETRNLLTVKLEEWLTKHDAPMPKIRPTE